jgi:arylsulfatase A-like enzyme
MNANATSDETAPTGAPPTERGTATMGDVMRLAIAAAVVAACVHVAQVEIRFRILKEFTWTGREFAWLALGGYVAEFLLAAIPVLLLVTIFRRWAGVRLAATLFAALSAFSMLLLFQRMHPISQLVLALGVGSVAGAWIAQHRAGSMRWIRRVSYAGIVTLVVTGVVTGGRLQSALAAQPAPSDAAHGERPNIILLILDTVRASNLSLYGYARPTTPVLDSLARDATVFEAAFSTAPWTAPSHATMMSGLWASQAGADYLNPIHDSVTTVAQVLGGLGYRTGGFMANAGYAGYQLGISRGFSHYEDFPFSWWQALWSTTLSQTGSARLVLESLRDGGRWKIRRAILRPDLRTTTVRKAEPQTADDIASHFLAWRDKQPQGPYFAMLNFFDAHAPYRSPGDFPKRFNGGRRKVDLYDGAIAYEDSIIGTIVARLRERGEFDRTVLIVTADHGEQFGEHHLNGHGNSLYLPLIHVPLLVRAPGRVPAGVRLGTLVSLRDIAATIVEFAGGPSGALPGTSLSHAWSGGDVARLSPVMAQAAEGVNPGRDNLTRTGPIHSVLDSAGHFVRYGDGREQLFDWQRDGGEVADLSTSAGAPARIAAYRERISTLLGVGWPPPRRRQH